MLLDAKEVYLGDLFGERYLFEIPNFQRPFSWRKENFEQLFEDIKDDLSINQEKYGPKIEEYNPYFLGSIILCVKTQRQEGSGVYEIIDGQQRIVSLSILMAVLRDFAEDIKAKNSLQKKIHQEEDEYSGTEESVRIKVRDKEREFYREYILNRKGTTYIDKIDVSTLSEPKQNMIEAINAFKRGLHKQDGTIDVQLIENYIKYILQKVVIVVVRTDSLSSAFRLFNIINARGLPLSNADLLKSENLRVIIPEKRQRYTLMWEDLEEDFGTEDLEMLISFIRSIKKKEKARRAIYEEFEKDIFKNEPTFRGEEFILYLNQIANIYRENILEASIKGLDAEKETYYYNLVSLMRDFLPFNDWIAAVIKFKEKFGANHLEKFLNKLEKKTVVDWIIGLSFTERLTQIYRVIRLLENEDVPHAVLTNSLLNSDIISNKSSFISSLNDQKFYGRGRTRIPKYVLLRLDMERKDNLNKRINYSGHITVEHILPRTPRDKYWLDRYNDLSRIEWTNKLGNLVLLNGRKNSQAGNKPFDKKVMDYFEKRSDFSITNELKNTKDWTLDSLQKRHIQLTNECVDIWIT